MRTLFLVFLLCVLVLLLPVIILLSLALLLLLAPVVAIRQAWKSSSEPPRPAAPREDPFPPTREDLEALIQAHVSEPRREDVRRLIRPVCHVAASRTDEATIPLGASKMGGAPDLPDEMPWPVAANGEALAFLAQFDLGDLSSLAWGGLLPPAGLLSFFCDQEGPWGYEPGDRSGWTVRHIPAGLQLSRRPFPPAWGPLDSFRSCRIRIQCGAALPLPVSDRIDSIHIERLSLTRAEREAYLNVLAPVSIRGERFPRAHQILGYAAPWEEIRLEIACEEAAEGRRGMRETAGPEAALARAAEWQLLFQFDSDEETRMMWGDTGMLYVFVRESELRAGRFDSAWVMMECC